MPTASKKSAAPTRKWIAARVTALAGLAVMYLTTGGWDSEESVSLVAILTEAAISYLTPNHETPGGVPTRPVDFPEDYVEPDPAPRPLI